MSHFRRTIALCVLGAVVLAACSESAKTAKSNNDIVSGNSETSESTVASKIPAINEADLEIEDLGDLALPETSIEHCGWPMQGQNIGRTHSLPSDCETEFSTATVGDLEEKWYFKSDDVVSAVPVVMGDTVYFGDWTGKFYAIDLATSELRWAFKTVPHDNVYAGQITAGAVVGEVDGAARVIFNAGKSTYSLDAETGELVWKHELGKPGDGNEPTEIEGSPVMADGLVIFGWEPHNTPGFPAGLMALNAASGKEVWHFYTDEDGGCADIWGQPSVDAENRMVIAGTGNCTREEGWGPYSEALFAVNLDTGEPLWAYQPHEFNRDDVDFGAAAPNLFEVDGRLLVGEGNKDGVYYTVDRLTGEFVWKADVQDPGCPQGICGSNFSYGGFNGSTAYLDGMIVGLTAIGGNREMFNYHGIDAATGEEVWGTSRVGEGYSPSSAANGLAIIASIDATLRIFDIKTGAQLVKVAPVPETLFVSGVAVLGDMMLTGGGFREPGKPGPSETAGVHAFGLAD